MVAALFASHPETRGEGNLGAALREVHRITGSDSIEARFMALLKAHREDLFDHLRHAVALIRGHIDSVPPARRRQAGIGWDRLLNDLLYWDSQARRVQREWARAFWSSPAEPKTEPTQTPNTQPGE